MLIWCSAPWGYLYRTEFLRSTKHPFAEDVLYEDSDFVMTHLYYAHRMSYSPKCAYQVYLNPTSTTHTSSYKHLSDYLFLGIRMFSLHRQIENDLVDYDSSVPYEYVVRFSESILEGGGYNIYKSCHRLIKLLSSKEVIAFYNRTDKYIDRSELLADNRLRRYYSSRWTRLCLGHRRITIFLSTIIIMAYRLMVIIKQKFV